MSSCASTETARARRSGRVLALWLLAAWPAHPASAGDVPLPFGIGRGVSVESLKEARFRRAVPQAYDFSCGAAAVATLLSYHYDRPTSEDEVFRHMYRSGDRERIEALGFSLLDMKRFLEAKGYGADGYRLTLRQLEAASVPAIALITTGGYRHFVVIQGITGSRVLLADPAQGVRELPREFFEAIRDPILLVIRPLRPEDAPGLESHWQLRASAPTERTRLDTRLSVQRRVLLRPGLGEF